MDPTRGRRLFWPQAVVGLLIFVALIVATCSIVPRAAHYRAILDELAIPAGWQLRMDTATEYWDCLAARECPQATREYEVVGRADDALSTATTTVLGVGFALERTGVPECTPEGCTVTFARRGDHLEVTAFAAGSAGDLNRVIPEGHIVVRIVAFNRK